MKKSRKILVSAFLTLPLLGIAFQPSANVWGETIISSGTTQTYNSSSMSFPITVNSGGTLVHSGNIGTNGQATDVLTISGTGNGNYGTTSYPGGALQSTASYGNGNGIFASVNIDGTASVLSTARIRFQGQVTGGTLETYSVVGDNPEVHAAYYSSFNIDKLIVKAGNFTFNGETGSSLLSTQSHIFKNGILVENGGFVRLWRQEDLHLYADEAKTTLATITLNEGAGFWSEGSSNNKFSANINAAGNSEIKSYTKVTQAAGKIDIASGKTLTISCVYQANAGTTINIASTGQLNSTNVSSSFASTINNSGAIAGTLNLASGGKINNSGSITGNVVIASGAALENKSAGTNLGASGKTITISGTGINNSGALYSSVACAMNQGVISTVNIDGSATVASSNRLRFQGKVTGGTLSTISTGDGEVHAGYNSEFAIEKLIVSSGNFTFNGSNGTALNDSQSHVFTSGITVNNGGMLRLWDQKDLQLYANTDKSALATITINAGGTLASQNSNNQLSANLYITADTTFAMVSLLTLKQGNIEIAGGKKLSITQNFSTSSGAGDIILNVGSQLFLNGVRTLGSDLVFNGDATIDLGSTAEISMPNNDLKAAGKTVTVAAGSGSPGKTWSLDSAEADKFVFNNSVQVTANSISGSLDLYNSTGITINENGSLLLGSDGISKHSSGGNPTNTVTLNNGSTLGLTAGTTEATINATGAAAGSGAIGLNLTGAVQANLAVDQKLTIDSAIGGTGSLTETGSGILILTGANSYTGNTTINGGTLFNKGTLAGNLIIGSDGTLAEQGTITGNTIFLSQGTINPAGAGTIGSASVANAAFENDSVLAFDVESLTSYDKLSFGENVTFSDSAIVELLAPSLLENITLDSFLDLATGLTDEQWASTHFSLVAPAIDNIADSRWILTFDAATDTLSARVGVPEPSTWILLIIGCLGCIGLGSTNRRRSISETLKEKD